eukprot:359694-Chlamydomonas_euryale.AAC.3
MRPTTQPPNRRRRSLTPQTPRRRQTRHARHARQRRWVRRSRRRLSVCPAPSGRWSAWGGRCRCGVWGRCSVMEDVGGACDGGNIARSCNHSDGVGVFMSVDGGVLGGGERVCVGGRGTADGGVGIKGMGVSLDVGGEICSPFEASSKDSHVWPLRALGV